MFRDTVSPGETKTKTYTLNPKTDGNHKLQVNIKADKQPKISKSVKVNVTKPAKKSDVQAIVIEVPDKGKVSQEIMAKVIFTNPWNITLTNIVMGAEGKHLQIPEPSKTQ